MTYILDLNDWELTLYKGEIMRYQAPAIAVAQEDQILFGNDALKATRLLPKHSYSSYLLKLNTEKLSEPIPRARTQADLVYLNLKTLFSGEDMSDHDLILSVPSTITNEKLSVLLGIVEELSVRVTGFIDSAVATIAAIDCPSRVHFIDIHLHHSSVTELTLNSTIAINDAKDVPAISVTSLMDQWAKEIADRFINETRFDPLHSAETEQQLYNQLTAWMANYGNRKNKLDHKSIEFAITHQENRWNITLLSKDLCQKANLLYEEFVQLLPKSSPILFSSRATRLPGLDNYIEMRGFTTITDVPKHAIARGCILQKANIEQADGSIKLVTSVPSLTEHRSTLEISGDQPPTHLLDINKALAKPINKIHGFLNLNIKLSSQQVIAGSNEEGITVNGEPLQPGHILRTGDELTDGTSTFLLIYLES